MVTMDFPKNISHTYGFYYIQRIIMQHPIINIHCMPRIAPILFTFLGDKLCRNWWFKMEEKPYRTHIFSIHSNWFRLSTVAYAYWRSFWCQPVSPKYRVPCALHCVDDCNIKHLFRHRHRFRLSSSVLFLRVFQHLNTFFRSQRQHLNSCPKKKKTTTAEKNLFT